MAISLPVVNLLDQQWLNTTGPIPVDVTSLTAQKWSRTSAAGSIQKLNVLLQIPAFSFPAISPTINTPYIVHQFNYTMPSAFTILNWQQLFNVLRADIDPNGPNQRNFILAIRWRTNDVVTRYRLNYSFLNFSNGFSPDDKFYYPFYTGQAIPANFTFEIWVAFARMTASFTAPLNFVLSLQQNPLVGNQANPVLVEASETPFNDLNFGLPFTIPLTPPTDGPWLSN